MYALRWHVRRKASSGPPVVSDRRGLSDDSSAALIYNLRSPRWLISLRSCIPPTAPAESFCYTDYSCAMSELKKLNVLMCKLMLALRTICRSRHTDLRPSNSTGGTVRIDIPIGEKHRLILLLRESTPQDGRAPGPRSRIKRCVATFTSRTGTLPSLHVCLDRSM